ncbi:CaiB/BaiF CoA-transferase family protein [Sphingomicrobium sp. XHP0235]|uniref:CaiB/BaiF CoA transferase family protein n=1 Tax=Sphingomicrobium aquimarinum TaxID=3133971 RepID=UPI0031FE58B9
MSGPLAELRIIELAGVGPGPFAAMMFADHGAEVIRIDREGRPAIPGDPLERGRLTIKLDLKTDAGREALLKLAASADALIDPYRPGRIETLGLGPKALHDVNPRLVIGRITGWGQTGPLSQQAGHDVNYLALSGLLAGMGTKGHRPVPPANLVADYGGGAMMLCFGMLAALLEVRGGAQHGRVVDAAMSEGSALLGSFLFGAFNAGLWRQGAEANALDGGAPLYGTYRCSDGAYLAVGAIEPSFRRQFLQALDLAGDALFEEDHPSRWPDQREAIEARIGAEPRAYWLDVFDGRDACVAPVLDLETAPTHPHHQARGAFARLEGHMVPAPAPRYGDGAEPFPARRERGGEAIRALLQSVGVERKTIDQILGSPNGSD